MNSRNNFIKIDNSKKSNLKSTQSSQFMLSEIDDINRTPYNEIDPNRYRDSEESEEKYTQGMREESSSRAPSDFENS